MKRAVPESHRPSGLERVGDLREHRQRAIERRRREMPERDVERLPRDVIHREIRRRALESRIDGGHEIRMRRTGARQPAQRVGEPRDIFRDEIEAKRLDGDQPIPLRFIGAKDRAKDAAADLVEDPERPEGGWGNETGGLVERQRGDSFGTSRIVTRSPGRAPTRDALEDL